MSQGDVERLTNPSSRASELVRLARGRGLAEMLGLMAGDEVAFDHVGDGTLSNPASA
jgi:hypothetical protein